MNLIQVMLAKGSTEPRVDASPLTLPIVRIYVAET